jgi:hypothetical protein
MRASKSLTALFVLAIVTPGAAMAHGKNPPAPPGLVTLDVPDGPFTIWPFTGTDLAGTASDPVNLVFLGDADPRQVRQALMALGGDRAAFGLPNAFPFNCTWTDAIGRHQTAWAEAERWQGSAIQMACGDYGSLRFHLRLFRQGRRTLGNVHFEVLIPGTTDHEVLAWEFAESFVVLDMVRTGALTATPSPTQVINPAPTYRTIRHQVFNGLPVPLRAVLGLPLANQSAPVPIPTNGMATVVSLWQPFQPVKSETRLEYDQMFNQTIPRPFCSSGPLDYLKVTGPLRFVHEVRTGSSGGYSASFSATGTLDVVPVNPLTGQPTGPAFQAEVFERHHSFMGRHHSEAAHFVKQALLTDPVQSFTELLAAGMLDRFQRTVDCGTAAP